jgi:hypothetical protein
MINDFKNTIQLLESLNERAKELNCLYQTDETLKDFDSPIGNIFKKILDIIPPGWQFPEICEGLIIYKDDQFKRDSFDKLKDGSKHCSQSSDFIVDNEKVGEIHVYYFASNDDDEEKLYFLKEEQKLLDAMADRISNYLFNRHLKETFGQWKEARQALKLLQQQEGKLYKIIRNVEINDLDAYFEAPSKDIKSPEELELILDTKSELHWKWRSDIAQLIASSMKSEAEAKERFGVLGLYLFGSVKNAESGPASDIDLLIHFRGSDQQRKELEAWVEGWSLCLSEMNYQKTGYKTNGIIDLHIITDEDIEAKDSFACKINSVYDPARKLKIGD